MAAVAARAQTGAVDFASEMWHDQKRIVTSPLHIAKKDWPWLVPLAGATTFLLFTDGRNMQERIHSDAAVRHDSLVLSNLGVGALAAMPVFLGWQGWQNREAYEAETAWLAARAVADSLVTGEVVRAITRRERPTAEGAGDFFTSGVTDSSFPSLHAASAWAMASVVAERYPGWLTKLAAYGLAGGVSISRVVGKEHSPSEVLVGSALGWLIGRYVAGTGTRQPWWDGMGRATPAREPDAEARPAGESSAEEGHLGSSYVPPDSWVYDVLDRLAAMGLIPSQTSGLRPWTRAECARQTREAERSIEAASRSVDLSEATEMVAALHKELDGNGGGVTLHSVYVRNGAIAGPALNDSFHFGQTWANDNGRPFGRGWNSNAGFTASAQSGRFFAYVQGEYQRAPGEAPYSLPVRQAIAQLDDNPLQLAEPQSSTSRFRTLDAYAGVRLGDFEFSVGKQSLWWGPTHDAPLSFSDNAEPTKNAKLSMVHPIRLPGFLGHLGWIRAELVLGKLGGQKYTWRPWFNAEKVSFKLTDNLEMGFTRWSIFWGVGHPITAGSLLINLTSAASPNVGGVGRSDPGDRKAGFDFRYRLPWLRNWVTLYSDSYADDDPSPLAAPRRAGINPGIYLTHVPGIPRMDLRVEAPSTMPMEGDMGGAFIYDNSQYHSGNTNYGYLLGNPVGRDGRAIEGWTRYWFSARTRIEMGYRQLKVGTSFLPGGGTQTDGTIKATLLLGNDWTAEVMWQYERFWIPLLGGPRRNISSWLQLTWEPNLQLVKGRIE